MCIISWAIINFSPSRDSASVIYGFIKIVFPSVLIVISFTFHLRSNDLNRVLYIELCINSEEEGPEPPFDLLPPDVMTRMFASIEDLRNVGAARRSIRVSANFIISLMSYSSNPNLLGSRKRTHLAPLSI